MCVRKGRALIGYFLSAIYWAVTAFFTVFWSLMGLIVGWPISMILDPQNKRPIHLASVIWAKCLIFFNPFWSLRVTGSENIQKGKAYVIISNHQSLIDILVVLAGLPIAFKFLSKKEVFSVPIMGYHMKLAGYIPVDRGNRQSGAKALEIAGTWLQKQMSVIFFPEGTRSADGNIKTFKPGAFRLAAEQQVEVLPVVVNGTGEALPKKSWRLRKSVCFKLDIGKPQKLKNTVDDIDLFKNEIRDDMLKRLKKLRSGAV